MTFIGLSCILWIGAVTMAIIHLLGAPAMVGIRIGLGIALVIAAALAFLAFEYRRAVHLPDHLRARVRSYAKARRIPVPRITLEERNAAAGLYRNGRHSSPLRRRSRRPTAVPLALGEE